MCCIECVGCKSEHFGGQGLDAVVQRHNRQSMLAISGISEGQSDVDEVKCRHCLSFSAVSCICSVCDLIVNVSSKGIFICSSV